MTEEVSIDHRVHSRIIGSRGRAVRKIMDEFKVDVRFPRPNDPDPNLVQINWYGGTAFGTAKIIYLILKKNS